MNITSSSRQPQAQVARTSHLTAPQSEKTPEPPKDEFQPGKGASSKLVPAFVAVGGAAAGLVGGFSNGVAGGIGGALSLGAAGASAATLVGAFEEFGGSKPDYAKRAAIGGGIGVAFGALVGSLSQSGGVAAGFAIAGTIGATLGYSFLSD